ncbi:MAG: Uncharacterized protein FD157_1473 [Rhodocyclaceae bacterium]|nr:MAG: Uncharacterized protein FD157_1473 [Rhodocyclaceae bacterium]TND01610.1 MAG: Uncharacterized protein FD118_2204 [Rhodocyclaceae bacterium]
MDVQLPTYLTAHWGEIKEFFNSVFFTAIAGSLAGAFAGAYGAQRIAERAKIRDQLLKEIRDTNTAMMVAFGICNSLITIKKQHLKALKENFETQKSALLEHQEKRKLGQISKDEIFHFRADLETLSLPPLPGDILQGLVFERLSLTGRPLALTTTLGQTVHALSAFLEKRNELIESYKAAGGVTPAQYFGLPIAGQIDQNYPAAISAICNQVDDGIFFSQLLCKDFAEHGNRIAVQFKDTFREDAPKINRTDFSPAKDLALMPNDESYPDWLTFGKMPIKESQ